MNDFKVTPEQFLEIGRFSLNYGNVDHSLSIALMTLLESPNARIALAILEPLTFGQKLQRLDSIMSFASTSQEAAQSR